MTSRERLRLGGVGRFAGLSHVRGFGVVLFWSLSLVSCGDSNDPSGADGDITIAPVNPIAGQFVEAEFSVSIRVASAQELSSVRARVGDATVELARGLTSDTWEGLLDLADTPSPSDQTIEYTAADAAGSAARDSVTVRLDRLPVVTILEPLDDAMSTRFMRVRATCTDDAPGGCESLIIGAWSGHGFTLAEAAGEAVDETVDLWQFEGSNWFDDAGFLVSVRGLDRLRPDTVADQTYEARTVYVDDSPHLTSVATSGTGRLLDANATHLLTVDGGRLDSLGTDTLRLVERASGQSTVLHDASGQTTRQGALFSGGAIFVVDHPAQGSSLKEWRNGALRVLATEATFFKAKGSYAIWTTQGRLFRRDLTGGTAVPVASGVPARDHDVAATGEVAWWSSSPYEIHLFRDGASEQLTDDGNGTLRNTLPLTDGTRVVYQRSAFPPVATETAIRLSDDPTEIELASAVECVPYGDGRVLPGREYQVNGGWIAYLRSDEFGLCHIWRRSAAGEESPADEFGYQNGIELLGSSGEIVFLHSTERYRAPVGGPAVEIGTWLGHPLYIDGQLHVMIGSTLLRVD